MVNEIESEDFYIIGNNLALDFANSATVDLTADSLAAWAAAVGLIEETAAKSLALRWRSEDVEKVARFRDRLRKVVERLVSLKDVSSEDIAWVNNVLREKGVYSELVKTSEGFAKKSRIDLKEPNEICVPILEAFVDLVAFGNIDHVRKCERPECILYFYDTTKNHKRRWCSMAICGNRAKVAKFYEKKRTKSLSGTPISE